MSARNSKRDALLQVFLENKPLGGEDFYAFSIVTDADEPTWDHRQTFVGGYEQAAVLCVAARGSLADSGNLKSGCSIAMYQGQNARGYLEECCRQEGCYRQERKGEGNN